MFESNPAPAGNASASPQGQDPSNPQAPANPANLAGFQGTSVPAMPQGGQPKYYNAQTGSYDWANHAREAEWVASQRGGQPAQPTGGQQSPAVESALAELTQAVASGQDGLQARLKLAQAGIPEAIIASHVNSVRQSQQAVVNDIQSYAGQQILGDASKGEAALNQMKAWAAANLSPAERNELNALVRSGHVKFAIDHVRSRMGTGGGASFPSVDNGFPSGGASSAFASTAEMTAAINDPKYRSDPAYRQQVQARVIATRRGASR